MTRPGPRTPKPRPRRHAGASRTLQPTVSAVVRERTGSAWSRTRPVHRRPRLRRRRALPRPGEPRRCGLGGGRRRAAPRLRRCPLAECAIVHADRDLVVVDKPAGMPSVPDQPGARGTMADCARTLLLAMGRDPDTPLDAVRRLDRDTSGLAVYARSTEMDEDHAHGRAVGDEGDDPHVGFACPRRSATSRSAGPVATCSTSPRRPRSTGSGSRRAACSGLDGRLERAAPHGARFFQPGGNRRAPPAISLTSGSRPALCVVIFPGAAAGRPRGPTNLIHLDPLVADDRGPAHDLVADELRVGLGRARDDVEAQLLQLLAHGGHGKCQLER
jgi:RNA pseudouridylate synthase